MLVINLIQSINLTAILTTLNFNLTAISRSLRLTFSDHFQQDKFTTFNLIARFQSYNTVTVKNLLSRSKINNGRKNYCCNSTQPFKVQAKGNFANNFSIYYQRWRKYWL